MPIPKPVRMQASGLQPESFVSKAGGRLLEVVNDQNDVIERGSGCSAHAWLGHAAANDRCEEKNDLSHRFQGRSDPVTIAALMVEVPPPMRNQLRRAPHYKEAG